MNTKYINACLRWLVNELYPFYNSKTLPAELMSKIEIFYCSVSRDFDWTHPRKEELQALGFLNWEETNPEQGVWFIPQWLFPAIPEGTILYDKNKVPFEFKQKIAETETMFGCLSYGVIINTEVIDEQL